MALADFQASFNGLTIGPGTNYDIFSIEGIDDWEVRSNDQTLPNLWGSQAGGDFVEPRTITLGVQMTSSLGVSAPLENAFVPSAQAAPTALQPLVFKLPDRQEVQVQCRVRRRGRARTPETEVSKVRWLFEIAAPDPRLYASTSTATVMTPYAADTTALDLTAGSGTGLGVRPDRFVGYRSGVRLHGCGRQRVGGDRQRRQRGHLPVVHVRDDGGDGVLARHQRHHGRDGVVCVRAGARARGGRRHGRRRYRFDGATR
jgi:hypothetical protein